MVLRHVVMFSALLALVGACGNDDPPSFPPPKVAVTAVGNPIGPPKTATIGAAGGSLTSEDGMLTLRVPASAVTADTLFAVTAIEPTGPGALRAYRLEPEGTRFAVAAVVSMTYRADDTAGSDPNALAISYQDPERRWRDASANVDPAGSLVSATTTHLSDWSLLRGMVLIPSQGKVKIGQSLPLEVKICDRGAPEPSQSGADLDLSPISFECQSFTTDLPPILGAPSVEGVVGGNAAVGTVSKGARFGYTAPRSKPTPNPVTVSIERPNGPKGKVILLSRITVTDEDPSAPAGGYTGTFQYKDTRGGPGTGSSASKLEGMATVTLSPRSGEPGAYDLTGTFTLSSAFAELPNCDCTATGGAAPLTGGMTLAASSKTYGWTAAAEVETAISCTKRPPSTADCLTTYRWGFNFASRDKPSDCTVATTETFATADTLAGTAGKTCRFSDGVVSNQVNVTWNFTAGN